MIKNRLLLLLVVIYYLTSTTNSQPSQSYWIGGNGNFHSFENWNPIGIPGVDDTIYLNTSDNVVTSQQPNTIKINSAYIGQNSSDIEFILNSVVSVSNLFVIEEGSSVATFPFTFKAGTLLNSGTFNISGTTFISNITNSGIFNIANSVTFGGNGFYLSGQINGGPSQITFNSELVLNSIGLIQLSQGNLNINQDTVLDDQSNIQLSSSSLLFNNNVVTLGNKASISAVAQSNIQLEASDIMLIEESSILICGSDLVFLSSSGLSLSDNTTVSITGKSQVSTTKNMWNLNDNSSISFIETSSLNTMNFNLNLYEDSSLTFDDSTLVANYSTSFNLYENSQVQSNSQIFIFDNSSTINLYDNSIFNINYGIFINTTFTLNNSSTFSCSSGSFQIDKTSQINAYGNSNFKIISSTVGFELENINFNDNSILTINNGFINDLSNSQFNGNSQFNLINSYVALNSSDNIFSTTSSVSLQGSKLTLNSNQINFGTFSSLSSSLNITNGTLAINGQYSIQNSTIITQTQGIINSMMDKVSFSGNNKGYITISNELILLNQTKLSLTGGRIQTTIQSFLVNATLSLNNVSSIAFFTPIYLQGTSSISNAGLLYLQTNVNFNQTMTGSISNSGVLNTPTGSKSILMTHITNTGNSTFNNVHIANYTQTKNGITVLDGTNGQFTSDNTIIINGGQFYGNSTINASLNVLNGTIGNANQLVNLTINGNFTLSSNASLVLTIGSSSVWSSFKVNGTANLQGSLTVFVLESIQKNINISLLDITTVSSNFSSIQFNFPNDDNADSQCQKIFYTETGFYVNFACPPPNKLSPGAITAIVFGCLAFVAIISFGSYYGYKYYNSKKSGYQPILSN